jgi:hypothetical protein
MKLSICLLGLLLTAGCGNRKQVVEPQADGTEQLALETTPEMDTELPNGTWVYYERTACFGTCPVFRFNLNHDGSCTYVGVNFVDRIGSSRGNVSEAEMQRIKAAIDEVNYGSLDEVYDNPMIMDLPAIITEVSGQRVVNRVGGPNLSSMYAALDALIESVRWTPVRSLD